MGQGDYEFKASLGYTRPCFKIKKSETRAFEMTHWIKEIATKTDSRAKFKSPRTWEAEVVIF